MHERDVRVCGRAVRLSPTHTIDTKPSPRRALVTWALRICRFFFLGGFTHYITDEEDTHKIRLELTGRHGRVVFGWSVVWTSL